MKIRNTVIALTLVVFAILGSHAAVPTVFADCGTNSPGGGCTPGTTPDPADEDAPSDDSGDDEGDAPDALTSLFEDILALLGV